MMSDRMPPVNNTTVSNMTVSRSQAKLRGVDEATMIQPLTTRGRVLLMRERCNPANHQFHTPNISRPLWNGKHVTRFTNRLFFCDIPKTGSQFLNHFFRDEYHPDITVGSFQKHFRNTDKYSRFGTRIIFVREPFSRFVSAYISKLFSVFKEWFDFKRDVSDRYRVKPSCGHDLTFREFIKFVIHRLEKHGSTDPHWFPHSDRCLPCQIRYNFIGKLHTANDDVQIVIDKFNLSETQTGKQFWTEYQRDYIKSMLVRAFAGNHCTNIHQALERYWMASQMRGDISHKAHFPYTAIKSNKYPDTESFFNMIVKSQAQFPVTLETKKLVKQVVLRHTFSHIDPDDIDKIRKLYYNDFYLYGYDMYPDFLTDKIPLTIDGWQPFKLRL